MKKNRFLSRCVVKMSLVVLVGILTTLSLTAQSKSVADLRQKMRLIRTINAPTHKYGGISFTRDGDRIFSRDNVYGIRIFSVSTGFIETAVKPCRGEKFTGATHTEDYPLYAVGCYRVLQAEIWDLSRAMKFRSLNVLPKADPYTLTRLSPDGTRVVISAAHEEPTELWHTKEGIRLASLNPTLTKSSWRNANAVEFSPDGSVIAISYFKELYLWNARNGKLLFRLEDPNKNLYLGDGQAHKHIIYNLLFSPDGRYLFSGSRDYEVKLWDVKSGRWLRTFRGHKAGITALSLSRDGKILATGSYDEKAKLWDVEKGRLIWTSPSHRSYVSEIYFSPDGERFITMTGSDNTGDENEIRMWETASGKLLGAMPGKWRQSFFSPDWRYFVTVGKKKNTIELYEFIDKVLP